MSGLGNEHNNGPHQDQIFDNPAALCLALWAKNRIQLWCVLGGGGGEGVYHLDLFMKGVFLSVALWAKNRIQLWCVRVCVWGGGGRGGGVSPRLVYDGSLWGVGGSIT